AARLAVHHHEVEHFAAGVHLHGAVAHLAAEGRVSADEQLLARLAACIECPANLCAPERTGSEQAGILAGEGHALGHALVDDVAADFRQAVNVAFAGAEVATLD